LYYVMWLVRIDFPLPLVESIPKSIGFGALCSVLREVSVADPRKGKGGWVEGRKNFTAQNKL
jgi:hypothetical protein